MPVILSQHYLATDRVYEDVEFSLYHYPRQYFSRVRAYDRFIYYRPLGSAQRRPDSLHYFGHGILGQPFEDVRKPDHRFVPVLKGEQFPRLVPLKEFTGDYYETESQSPPVGVSAVRDIADVTYHRILAAAGVSSTNLERSPSADSSALVYYSPMMTNPAPKDALREIREIPPGAGYVPGDNPKVSIFESAALQERARADHQAVLQELARLIQNRGGRTWYNNNIDLLGDVEASRMLIEAKSLNVDADAVHRMRYGMGQLFDYRHRYQAEINGATPVLAFGRLPDRADSWISSVLQENGVAFISLAGDKVIACNRLAETLPIFD